MIGLLLVGAALAGELTGQVRELGSGDPLSDAVVQLAHSSEVFTVVTDARGVFRVTLTDAAGPLQVVASHDGHLTGEVSLTWPTREPVRLVLPPAPAGPEIVVEAHRPSDHAVRHVLDRERVEKTPGTFDDPVRLLQSLPGVAVTPEYSPSAGVLAVRGAAPAESRVFLDGIELPYLYHFQNYASVIHSRLLDEVALYPSAFSAEWGDTIGGVAAVTTRRPDPVRVHGGVNLNAITTGAYVQAPLEQVDDAAVSLSARRSIADLIDDSNDQYTVWPVFWDYLGRVDLGRGDRTLALTALGAGDGYGRYPGDTATFDPLERTSAPEFRYRRAFHAVTAVAQLGDEAQLHRMTVGFTQDEQQGEVDDDRQLRRERAVSLRHRTDLFASDVLRWSFGGDARLAGVRRDANPSRSWTELGTEAPLLATGVPVDESLRRVSGGVWGSPVIHRGPHVIQTGLRLQGDSLSRGWAPEPRLSMVSTLADMHRLRLAVGRYSQAPSADALSPTTGIPDLGLATSDQVAAGLDLMVGQQVELTTDLYARFIHDTVEVDPADASGLGAVRVRDGRAGGVELVARTRSRDHYFVSASLVLSRSQRRQGIDGPWVVGDYDQPLAFNLVASWDFAPHWNGGLRYRYASGLPVTPLGGSYDGDTDTWRPVPLAENSGRMPNYQKVDLHIDRTWTFQAWRLVGYVEAWWVPPRSNAMYRVYSYDYSETRSVAGPPFVPLVGLRAEI